MREENAEGEEKCWCCVLMRKRRRMVEAGGGRGRGSQARANAGGTTSRSCHPLYYFLSLFSSFIFFVLDEQKVTEAVVLWFGG